mgnify:CR=1 FL=1
MSIIKGGVGISSITHYGIYYGYNLNILLTYYKKKNNDNLKLQYCDNIESITIKFNIGNKEQIYSQVRNRFQKINNTYSISREIFLPKTVIFTK